VAESYLKKSIWSIWTTKWLDGFANSNFTLTFHRIKLDSHSTYFHTAVYLIGTVLSVPMNRTATAIESSPVRNWISSSFCASVSWRSTATDPSIWKWSVILHGVLKLSEMNVGCLRQELFCIYIYIFYRYSRYPSSMPCATFSVSAWGKENSTSGWATSLPSIKGIRSQTLLIENKTY